MERALGKKDYVNFVHVQANCIFRANTSSFALMSKSKRFEKPIRSGLSIPKNVGNYYVLKDMDNPIISPK